MDKEKLLLGGTFIFPEAEEDGSLVQNNLNARSSNEYDYLDIVDSIGTSEFKTLFLSNISAIKLHDFKNQRRFCSKILEKVKDEYEYEFLPFPKLEHQIHFNNVYELIQFLEFDHIEYFADVWKFLKTDLKKTDVSLYCKRFSTAIVTEIEDQINSRDINELISILLRTYNKDKLVGWFSNRTVKSKMLIYLRILEEKNV